VKKFIISWITVLLLFHANAFAKVDFAKERITTSSGEVVITFIGHASLMIAFNGKIIQVDPWSKQADYSTLAKADLILLTHQHGDHLDPNAIEQIRTPTTKIILTALCAEIIKGGEVMANNSSTEVMGIRIEAVPAYNLVNKRDNGEFFHPRGVGNGYVLTFGNTRIYIAGDTENVPEMKALRNIDYAFLPMMLPYTMSAAMVTDAAIAFKPKVLFPYHYGTTDTGELKKLLRDHPGIEVRVHRM
jgi:L-ascorbate metabolism protein UlaG (beta-lactamase superfamily)